MVDSSLNDPVVVQATRLDASILPRNIFSQSYLLYVINQGADVGAIAGKANQAGQGAYDAQVKNDEQDVELADHDARITANTKAINLLEVRLTTAEGKIVVLRSDVDYLLDEVIDIQAHLVTVDQRLDGVESDVSDIKSDYVSKTVTESQSLASPLDVKTSYSVDGIQVVGARNTGWTAATGTPLLGSFNANQSYTVGTTYTQSEVAALATGLQQARQRILALETALRLTWVPMSILNVSTKRSRSLSRHFPYSLNLAWSAAGVAKPHNRGCNRNLDNGQGICFFVWQTPKQEHQPMKER